MLKDEIFFGENGLTTTSANHIANPSEIIGQHLGIVTKFEYEKY